MRIDPYKKKHKFGNWTAQIKLSRSSGLIREAESLPWLILKSVTNAKQVLSLLFIVYILSQLLNGLAETRYTR